MDLEQLKMILDTIEAVGGDAKEFGFWYIALHYGTRIFGGVLFFLFGLSVVFAVRYIVYIVGYADLWRVADAAGVKIVGGTWGHEDTKKLIQTIRELKDAGTRSS